MPQNITRCDKEGYGISPRLVQSFKQHVFLQCVHTFTLLQVNEWTHFP